MGVSLSFAFPKKDAPRILTVGLFRQFLDPTRWLAPILSLFVIRWRLVTIWILLLG
jgi:hypothetical protein